ncbi:MAG: type II toxin-antitoxin system prevent-host-death family antitoxin [Gemmatimonadaceae bacterium]
MVSVGIRELKNNLSRYLRKVQAGERVLVTDRGRAIAELRSPEEAAATEDPHMATFNRLVREGVIRPGRGGDPFAKWPPKGTFNLPPGTAQRLIDEDRDEGW